MTDEVRTTSSTGGQKGVKLARYGLIPVKALRGVAEIFGLGAAKYEDRNWERGYEWSKSYDAAQRHLNQFWDGEDYNDDDFPGKQVKHVLQAAWHCLVLATFMDTHPEFDDRVTAKKTVEVNQAELDPDMQVQSLHDIPPAGKEYEWLRPDEPNWAYRYRAGFWMYRPGEHEPWYSSTENTAEHKPGGLCYGNNGPFVRGKKIR